MEENAFFSIEQSDITIIPVLQKLENRIPDRYMAILWDGSGHFISIKKNITIGYMKESDYIEKPPKLNNREILGKFLKYLKINDHLCLGNQH